MTTSPTSTNAGKPRFEIRKEAIGDAVLLHVSGIIDEAFRGFEAPRVSTLVLDLAGLTRMTSYGVRQWMRAREALPETIQHLYYINCPPFFVDQLNMVLGFGGNGRVVTAMAPFACTSCGKELQALVDVLREHDGLVVGKVGERTCPECGGKMELEELAETFFSFVKQHGARSLSQGAATLLGKAKLYHDPAEVAQSAQQAPARVLKLVHDRVTYYRIVGALDDRFRARPFLDGVEGEVVIDLREVSSANSEGALEWNKLIEKLRREVSRITLIGTPPCVAQLLPAGRMTVEGTTVFSVSFPFECAKCKRTSAELVTVWKSAAPITLAPVTCASCGGQRHFVGDPAHAVAVEPYVHGPVPQASLHVIRDCDDLLSRAQVEAQASPGLGRADGILGKYQIVSALSVGGMAEVFLAVQKGIGGFEKPVALKRIRKEILEKRHLAVEMFLNEAKIAASLAHPNIAQIFDVGEEEGLLYLAMEYVRGKDLRHVLRRAHDRKQRIHLADALFITQAIASALHHAYTTSDMSGRQLKAVHRDVSPSNILIGFDGSVKLVDFGVALSNSTRAQDGAFLAGKYNYMSPEQTLAAELDNRSDLFSLGICLYEMLTGHRPFARASREETLRAVQAGEFQPPGQLVANLPSEIDALVRKMMAHRPADRFSSGEEIAGAIRQYATAAGLHLDAAGLRQRIDELFRDTPEMKMAASTTGSSGPTASGPASTRTPEAPLQVSPTEVRSILAGISESIEFSDATTTDRDVSVQTLNPSLMETVHGVKPPVGVKAPQPPKDRAAAGGSAAASSPPSSPSSSSSPSPSPSPSAPAPASPPPIAPSPLPTATTSTTGRTPLYSFDEGTISKMISPPPSWTRRLLMIGAILVAAGLLVALWFVN
jgi:serine/threonine protein kinase/anti-anti-sigma regulatory factor